MDGEVQAAILSVGHQKTWRTNVHSLAVSVSELELSEQKSTNHDDVRRKKTVNGLSVKECRLHQGSFTFKIPHGFTVHMQEEQSVRDISDDRVKKAVTFVHRIRHFLNTLEIQQN